MEKGEKRQYMVGREGSKKRKEGENRICRVV